MISHRRVMLSGALVLALSVAAAVAQPASAAEPTAAPHQGEPARAIPLSELRSGSAFQSATTRAEQNDLSINPGMLWVEQGIKLWHAPEGLAGKSCASCHGAIGSMKGAATKYPLVDAASGRLMLLADRIRECRTLRQGGAELAFESEPLLSLTAAVAHQSRGEPIHVTTDGSAATHIAAGQRLFVQRQGQLNLSCANCHDQNWGKRARNETISQGQPNGFPAYRLEWQTLGSLERRLKACFLGVRAEPLAPDSPELRQLELYLAWRAEGMPIETPAVRR